MRRQETDDLEALIGARRTAPGQCLDVDQIMTELRGEVAE